MLTSLLTVASLATLSQASPLAPHSLPTSQRSSGVLAPLHVPPPPPFLDRLLNPHAAAHPPPNPQLYAQQQEQLLYDSLTEDSGRPRPTEERHLIPNSYIIKLKSTHHHQSAYDSHIEAVQSLHSEDVESRRFSASADQIIHDLGGLSHEYHINAHGGGDGTAFRGYGGKFSEEVIERIRGLEGVEYVEVDSTVWAMDDVTVPFFDEEQAGAQEVQKFVPWGLHRISHKEPIGFQTLQYQYEAAGAGEGVTAYVIDTGINIDHVELEGRAKWGATFANDGDYDGNGHGSHVSGTIGSSRYGVAKKVNLVAVKVLGVGGSGSMTDVIDGVEFAANSAAKEAAQAKKDGKKHKGSVANMSLGGGKSQGLDDAVTGAVESGLHFAVAAGNDNRDACGSSPAAAEAPITVGASTLGDNPAYFSNHGPCVDVFAPGLNILSIWNSGNRSTNVISGTSMASPHVAGLLAYFLSLHGEGKLDVEAILKEAKAEEMKRLNKKDVIVEMEMIAAEAFESGRKDLNHLVDVEVALAAETMEEASEEVQSIMKALLGLFKPKNEASRRPAPYKVGIEEAAPKKDEPLSPKALKTVLTHLSLKGVLEGLPERTKNVLIFNNFNSTV